MRSVLHAPGDEAPMDGQPAADRAWYSSRGAMPTRRAAPISIPSAPRRKAGPAPGAIRSLPRDPRLAVLFERGVRSAQCRTAPLTDAAGEAESRGVRALTRALGEGPARDDRAGARRRALSSRRSAGEAGASVGIGVPTARASIQLRTPIPPLARYARSCGMTGCSSTRPRAEGREPARSTGVPSATVPPSERAHRATRPSQLRLTRRVGSACNGSSGQ